MTVFAECSRIGARLHLIAIRIAVVLVCGIVLAGSACKSTSDPLPVSTIEAPSGQYTHKGSGMEFPEAVGAFTRVGIDQYDGPGDDISVGYNNTSHLVAATVYVYPAGAATVKGSQPGETHFQAVKAEIENAHPGATLLIADDRVNLAGAVGRKAAYRFEAAFAGANRSLASDVYLFGFDTWFISYRFTYPEADADLAVKEIGDFVDSLKWP